MGRVSTPTITLTEAAKATAIAERLRSVLRESVLAVQSGNSHSVRTLAQRLGINRNVCQRINAGSRAGLPPLVALVRMPGIDGLRSFAVALASAGVAQRTIDDVNHAVDQFAEFLAASGRSHSSLVKAIATSSAGAVNIEEHLAARDRLIRKRTIRNTAELLGYSMEAQLTVVGFGPEVGASRVLESWMSQSFVNLRSSGGVTPIPVTLAQSPDGFANPIPGHAGTALSTSDPNQGILLRPFCTDPLPTFTRLGNSAVGVHVIDAKTLPNDGEGTTFATAVRRAPVVSPLVSGKRFLSGFARVRHPVDRFVYDVYLDRDLAKQSVPSAGAFAFSPALSENPESNWPERLPGPLSLQVLAPGLTGASCRAWARHAEVTRFMFDQFGWQEGDFVGYRLEVEYPIWGAVYLIAMEFPGKGE